MFASRLVISLKNKLQILFRKIIIDRKIKRMLLEIQSLDTVQTNECSCWFACISFAKFDNVFSFSNKCFRPLVTEHSSRVECILYSK